mmetsp:Transcript_4041/g.5600  ORF Transcript_4041/g.5600 Transcript_4041/m.5600 type:complete len:528 (+) Transcript_4041:109-1692(+)
MNDSIQTAQLNSLNQKVIDGIVLSEEQKQLRCELSAQQQQAVATAAVIANEKMQLLWEEVKDTKKTLDRLVKQGISPRIEGPRTRSEWVKNLEEKNLLMQENEFFSAFDMSMETSEDLLRLLDGHKITKYKYIMGNRQHFGNIVTQLMVPNGRRHEYNRRLEFDGGNKPPAGIYKPDYVLRANDCSGELSVILIGVIKEIADTDREFSDEEVGQTIDFILEVLTQQAWRQHLYGFLTDGVRFEFFRGTRIANHVMKFSRSGLISEEGRGWQRLSQLLQESDELLGFKLITVEGWTIGEWLGSGATSSAFVASSVDIPEAVCKIYIPDTEEEEVTNHREKEIRAMTLMVDDEFTPKVVSAVQTTSDHSLPVLVVTPRGEKLGPKGVRLPISAYSKLVGTLRSCHLKRMCHLDVCPENMLAVKNELTGQYSILLNDWGSSLTFRELDRAERFPTHLLYYNINRMGQGEDLAALVRSVFVLTQCTFPLVKTAEELDIHMRLQWHWGEALDAAWRCNYQAVETFLSTGNVH